MILGVLSDTHKDKANAIPHIIREFKKRNVEVIFHCGDIEPQHLDHELFGDFPVICALTEEQVGRREYCFPPNQWAYTKPGDRIITLPNGLRFYLGHKRAFEFLTGSETELIKTLKEIRKDADSVQWLFSGHTHHQIYRQDQLVSFVNPGAIEDSYDGYEYAIVDTETKETLFSRIPLTHFTEATTPVGLISDSSNITDLDASYWDDLSHEFKKRNVKHVIHCGNISLDDIGREELSRFNVYCYLRTDQNAPKELPGNWKILTTENPTVTIAGQQFYIQHDLGASIVDQSEIDMQRLSLNVRVKYPETRYILFGLTHHAFLEEGEQVRIINPGDVVKGRNYAIVTLPLAEIVFGRINPTRVSLP